MRNLSVRTPDRIDGARSRNAVDRSGYPHTWHRYHGEEERRNRAIASR